MTLQTRTPMVPFLPESAPFSAEQRAWLNGFFAGVFSADAPAGATALSPAEGAALLAPTAPAEADDGAPWHDAAMPLDERMKLAEGKPLDRRMMAAMAQQDCGQCGYICESYSKALAAGTESKLNLCAPGGKETLRMLKQLAAELGGAPATPAATAEAAPAAPVSVAHGTRENPADVTFLGRFRLNKDGSEKETWHVDFDLAGSGLDYQVGDSFGLFPVNDPQLVQDVLAALHAPADFPIGEKTLEEVLSREVCLKSPPDTLFSLISYITGGARKETAKALAAGGDPDGDAATLDVLAALEKFPGIRPDPEAFVECLEPLQPRLYSISSSPAATPGRLSLTVDTVRYDHQGRTRHGVCSTFLAGRVAEGTRMKAYVQKAHGFGLPADAARPVIMVGPGTGIAPFRAFLHERMATKAPGRNWLFFGHQRAATDFFYEDELSGMQAAGVLSRLDTAWSRDGEAKVYVQDRIRAAGPELWAWMQEGAHFYVCGDAKRMAKDVEAAVAEVAATHGGLGAEGGARFVAELKKAGRYQADVY